MIAQRKLRHLREEAAGSVTRRSRTISGKQPRVSQPVWGGRVVKPRTVLGIGGDNIIFLTTTSKVALLEVLIKAVAVVEVVH